VVGFESLEGMAAIGIGANPLLRLIARPHSTIEFPAILSFADRNLSSDLNLIEGVHMFVTVQPTALWRLLPQVLPHFRAS
jgi:hypothetical protein